MHSEASYIPLIKFLEEKPSINAILLNEILCQVLDAFSRIREGCIPDFDLDFLNWQFSPAEEMVVFPHKYWNENVPEGEIRTKFHRWVDFLKERGLSSSRPSRHILPSGQQEKINQTLLNTIHKKVAAFDGTEKIHLMGAAKKKKMYVYGTPYIKSELVRLGSDIDLLVELKGDREYQLPKEWIHVHWSASKQCDLYRLGDVPFEHATDHELNYPNIPFYHHLLKAYVFCPFKGRPEKKELFLKAYKAEAIYSSSLTGNEKRPKEEMLAYIERRIRKEYRIRPIGIAPLEVSTENELYRFSLNEKRYVLKCYKVSGNYPSTRLVEHAIYEAKFIRSLRGTDVKTAQIFRTKNEKPLMSVKGNAAILYSYVEGTIYKSPDPEYPIQESTKALASLHRLQMKKPLTICRNFTFEDVFHIWHKEYEGFAGGIAGDSSLANAFLSLRGMHRETGRAFVRLNTSKEIPLVHNHGDITPRNFVINNGTASLIDFQNAFYGSRLSDVVDGAYEFSFGGKPPGKDDFSRFHIFMNAYFSELPLMAEEAKFLDDMIRIVGIIKFIKEVRMMKGSKKLNNQRRLRALSISQFLINRYPKHLNSL